MTTRLRPISDGKSRCGWVGGKPHFIRYHDQEWGVPVHSDRKHFEMLLLEGAQAGLTWETILLRRDGYRRAFAEFDPKKVARFTAKKKAVLLNNPGIIRNRLKIDSAVTNAQAFLSVQEEFGSPRVPRATPYRRISRSVVSGLSAARLSMPTCRRLGW
jgi:DNA-3-methyladenine glycosylase I